MLTIACLLAVAMTPSLSYVESPGGFQTPVLDGGRTELEFADLDNDGNLDIVSIGDHGNPYINTQEHGVMVWFGDGDGNWSVFQYGDFGYGGIAVGDVNGDGVWDVGYGMHHNYSGVDLGDDMLEVALGEGTGQMWTAWDDSLIAGGTVWGMFSTDFADVDNDDDLDVGSTSFGYGIGDQFFLNRGDGTWQHSFGASDSNNNNMEFYFRDVNRDGNVDIISASCAASVGFGDGAGGFTPCDTGLPTSSYGLSGISPGDVDNDGGCDVAFANDNGGVEVWKWNEPTHRWVSFSGALPTSGSFEGTQLCDMNTDGFTDVCALGGGHTKVWLGDGAGNWTEAVDITTPSPGYYSAFRAGGDFDHNGRPDIAFVADEGTWPSDHNVAHAFKESTPAESLRAFPVFPRGGEVLRAGSVQFIDWWSEAPAPESSRVRLELSTEGRNGPWDLIADTLRNAGRYQWSTPLWPRSDSCFVRYTVSTPGESTSAVTARAFTIFGPTSTAARREQYPLRVLTITPNPAGNRTVVALSGKAGARVQVYRPDGTRVLEQSVKGAGRVELLTAAWPAGAYFIKTGDRQRSAVAKLVVQH